jgi:hypothetical protein
VSAAPSERRPGTDGEPRPLRTEARPLSVHVLVDAAVAFLALIIVGLILGATWWAVLIVAVVLGVVAGPFTHRADERAMAARRAA